MSVTFHSHSSPQTEWTLEKSIELVSEFNTEVESTLHDTLSTTLSDIELRAYNTKNLIACKATRGNHGGFLITVQVNSDFQPNEVDHEARKYYRDLEKYERFIVENEELKNKYSNDSLMYRLYQYKAAQSPKPIPPSNLKKTSSSFELRAQFLTFSANPESEDDPQGDINWFLFLPIEMQKLFGFSKNEDLYTFPDHNEINGAIQEFNRLATFKGMAESLLPLRVGKNAGKLSNDEYLESIAKGELPLSLPKEGYSWFYHDLLYHVIGMLVTPHKNLTQAIKIAQLAVTDRSINNLGKKRLTLHLDNNTTFAHRIQAIKYVKSHTDIDFYCFHEGLVPKTRRYYREIIIAYAFFSQFVNNNPKKKNSRSLFIWLNSSTHHNEHQSMISKMNTENIIEHLTTEVENQLKLIQDILG